MTILVGDLIEAIENNYEEKRSYGPFILYSYRYKDINFKWVLSLDKDKRSRFNIYTTKPHGQDFNIYYVPSCDINYFDNIELDLPTGSWIYETACGIQELLSLPVKARIKAKEEVNKYFLEKAQNNGIHTTN